MRLLLIGGTRFLGRAIAEQALGAGHRLTLLHRGQSNPALFPEAEHRMADRDGDLGVLDDAATWDTVIDTCAYVPRQVNSLAARLRGRVGQYQLVSSISVYADLRPPGVGEDAPTQKLDDPHTEQITGASYGGLKRLCEEAALAGFGDAHTLIVRPGLLVGPHDPTGRFSWWVQRLQHGGDVLVPGPAGAALQFIDARDAAAWQLRQADARTAGVFNLTGPVRRLDFGRFFATAQALLSPTGTRLVWADGAWLEQQGVTPWSELPLWVGSGSPGLHAVNIDRARNTGLTTRPVEATLQDTAAWLATAGEMPPPGPSGSLTRPSIGLAPEREAALRRRLDEPGPYTSSHGHPPSC